MPRKQRYLHVLFDFKKAFNKVSHSLLWSKLIQIGIGGRFLNLLKAMYSQVKSCVRAGDSLTKAFDFKRGVRQGCLHSPMLFALFMNDLKNNILHARR